MRDSITIKCEDSNDNIIVFDITGISPEATDANLKSFVSAIMDITYMRNTSVYRVHTYAIL